jgi:hypothetical protein
MSLKSHKKVEIMVYLNFFACVVGRIRIPEARTHTDSAVPDPERWRDCCTVEVHSSYVGAAGGGGGNEEGTLEQDLTQSLTTLFTYFIQCSVSGLDPGSIRSVDTYPHPDSESGSGSRSAKMTHRSRKN